MPRPRPVSARLLLLLASTVLLGGGPVPTASAQAPEPGIRVYEPAVKVRSQSAERDVKKLDGAPANLRRYLPTYLQREVRRTRKELGGALPESCTRRMVASVERIDGTGWAVVGQRLANASSCGFDAAQQVVVEATRGGRGHVAVRLGSGGMPDCDAVAATGAPAGLVLGC